MLRNLRNASDMKERKFFRSSFSTDTAIKEWRDYLYWIKILEGCRMEWAPSRVIYGRAVMGISRKIRDGDSKAGTIVEQAISSVRTVYSFVEERKSIADYSAALEGCVELGVRQGLAKGLFVGSTAIGFVIRALMSYYGSRLVMYNGAHGDDVFIVTVAISVGGL
ncbi:hypothetical protein CQW23_16530 [Capsicum baccatum]|uniref:ABC transmembrane type-1 domain-containing protein n=1 Tax=Capsicum baccatum TaxID=33114 RepID=A0A2G2WB77_CAPBA|nr:hypothetical protein CQW23_16530 [Capsicum baccatum]